MIGEPDGIFLHKTVIGRALIRHLQIAQGKIVAAALMLHGDNNAIRVNHLGYPLHFYLIPFPKWAMLLIFRYFRSKGKAENLTQVGFPGLERRPFIICLDPQPRPWRCRSPPLPGSPRRAIPEAS